MRMIINHSSTIAPPEHSENQHQSTVVIDTRYNTWWYLDTGPKNISSQLALQLYKVYLQVFKRQMKPESQWNPQNAKEGKPEGQGMPEKAKEGKARRSG